MSHFTVMVVTDQEPTDEILEAALAPYQENNNGDCPEQYLKFNDVEDEYRQEWENDSIEMVRVPLDVPVPGGYTGFSGSSDYVMDGYRYYHTFDNRFTPRVPGDLFARGEPVYPEGHEIVTVPYRQLYPEFEQFLKSWGGYERDPKTGRFGYWENPNKKWDWWVVGGRWGGLLRHRGGFDADICRVGDLDFKAMLADRMRERGNGWDTAEAKFREDPNNAGITFVEALQQWRDFIAQCRTERKEDEPLYDVIKRNLQDERLRNAWHHAQWDGGISDKYIENPQNRICRDEYTGQAVPLGTFAVLMDGQWYAQGDMGWFATVSNENDDWDQRFNELLNTLRPDQWITIVDCHI